MTSWSSITNQILSLIWNQIDGENAPPETLSPELELEDIASSIFRKAIYKLPSTVRVWWRDLNNRKLSSLVEKFTAKFISPELIDDEMRRIQEFNKDKGKTKGTVYTSNLTADASKFTVTGWRGSINEVHAAYEKDEVVAEIVLVLADNYPLRAVTVTSKHRMGINESTWRTWLLSMTTLLMTQDGTVLDAALLWQNSLDKHFDGTELCPICYALFHASNHSLPSLPCKTCKTKFHSGCLYTWFNNSHKNECPICRSPFS